MEHYSIEERIRIDGVDFPGNLRLVQQSGSVEGPDNASLFTTGLTHSIRSVCLQRYLQRHLIPLHVAQFYRSEAWCSRGKNFYDALAFHIDGGGFNPVIPDRHYRLSAGDISLNPNGSQAKPVFRQIFDLVSYVPIFTGPIRNLLDFLVVKAPYRPKQLLIPNDITGISLITVPAPILKLRRHRVLPIQASEVLPAGFAVLEPANTPKSHHLTSKPERYLHLFKSP
jgi:hypothetical protein